jgi:hypothetical protein
MAAAATPAAAMLAMAEARAGAMTGRESDFVRKRAFWRFSQSRKRVSESARFGWHRRTSDVQVKTRKRY